MRDIKRIDKFLDALKTEWFKVPDWRFGQLMSNFISSGREPFYLEEDEFIEMLKDYLSERNKII